MRTVKEISGLTGISVRTVHYYDKIGLLKPTDHTEAGYRLYDDKALETLQQILFYREFDMPLKDIKAAMESPDFDRITVLNSQKSILELKKKRLERLITSIDGILKGENKMDFEVFNKEEIEELFHTMVSNMESGQVSAIAAEYGSLEQYEEQFIKSAGNEHTQKNLQKVVKWYGSRKDAADAAKNSAGPEIMDAYQNRIDDIFRRLAAKTGTDVSSFEVKQLIGEYDFVAKQLYQMKDVERLLLDMAGEYRKRGPLKESMEARYGAGAPEYIADAVQAFYAE
ncbi:MerR family transcriptional regulator [Extibacter muris]|uniref:MerR family transcriptional regulator n=1 Tax=Extibacter muris TaxID=1796622 RepID=UPI001D08B492|nr:MerR family transcriptional regulator [Extibacter muris]MCB6202466.1 MerR family transcriptional regulator [Extibacter muris]MCQ4664909.1 MerR family transcriptional regulator [Extibacter muris]MCQ4694274.1 MerR family transcriptional regulator [Extibacter muris]